ncbi:MAG TPA: flavodoxin domain-containing protein [Kofleriaceae bacterium]|nr:flavodoxin domain-containing protein [Kofleriaceae bacterium]
MTVELAELGSRPAPPLADYDAVVIGAHVRLGRHDRAVIDYIREHRGMLVRLPAFFYSVGGHGVFDRDTYAHRMTRRTGWVPTATTSFADAGALQRGGVRAFARVVADETPFALQPSLA